MRDIYRKQIENQIEIEIEIERMDKASRSDERRTLARDWLKCWDWDEETRYSGYYLPCSSAVFFLKAAGCHPFIQGQEAITYTICLHWTSPRPGSVILNTIFGKAARTMLPYQSNASADSRIPLTGVPLGTADACFYLLKAILTTTNCLNCHRCLVLGILPVPDDDCDPHKKIYHASHPLSQSYLKS